MLHMTIDQPNEATYRTALSGPKSFEDLCIVEGKWHSSFRSAILGLSLYYVTTVSDTPFSIRPSPNISPHLEALYKQADSHPVMQLASVYHGE